jgi:hypothetical protein
MTQKQKLPDRVVLLGKTYLYIFKPAIVEAAAATKN